MSAIKYVPKEAQGAKAKFEGHIELTAPSFDQRFQYIEECNFEVNDKGEISESMNQLGSLRKMVSLTQHHYKSVALKSKNGKEYKSFEDLSFDPDCNTMMIEVASFVMNGFTPGKK